eukprot:153858_1
METVETELTKLFGIKYPIMLAGMGKISGPEMAAAVTNAGGIGCIGGIGFTPRMLKIQLDILKRNLTDKNAPFGVDLLLPKVGGGARPTNKDYTDGKLEKLIDVICESGTKLFICAVGVAPSHVVKKLHDNGVLYMNMIGSPKHVKYALDAGADILCCQGGEGGGHTGEVATTCLLPKAIDMVKGCKSPLTGQPIYCVGAGGIYDGRGVAMALTYGAQAVWCGTRFVNCLESGATAKHKENIIESTVHDTMRTEIYTGRPLRVFKHEYAMNWETNRKNEMRKILQSGVLPFMYDIQKRGGPPPKRDSDKVHLVGQCCGNITDVKSAKQIIEDMMDECVKTLRCNAAKIKLLSKL